MSEISKILNKLTTPELKKQYITRSIIPAMDKRRGRNSPISEVDVAKKLWSPPISNKPGEEHELAQSMTKEIGEQLSIETALEIADVVYYYLQPNAPEKANLNTLELFIFLILGEMSLAYDFAIIKYLNRLEHGDLSNYREIENDAMQNFFNENNVKIL